MPLQDLTRPLGALEASLLWACGTQGTIAGWPEDPRLCGKRQFVAAVCAHFAGYLSPSLLEAGVEWVMRRHPILRAAIVSEGERLRFSPFPSERWSAASMVRVVSRGSADDWQRVCAEECEVGFPLGVPHWRLVLLQDSTGGELALVFGHHIADGPAALTVLHDLFAATAIEETERAVVKSLPPSPPLELAAYPRGVPPLVRAVAGVVQPLAKRALHSASPWPMNADVPFGGIRAGHIYADGSEDNLAKLRAAARSHGVRLSATILAAYFYTLAASPQMQTPGEVAVTTAVWADGSRTPSNLDPGTVASLATCAWLSGHITEATKFWKLAAKLQRSLYRQIGMVRFVIALSAGLCSDAQRYAKLCTGLPGSLLFKIAFSNSGQFPVKRRQFGTVRLTGLHVHLNPQPLGGSLFLCCMAVDSLSYSAYYSTPYMRKEEVGPLIESFVRLTENAWQLADGYCFGDYLASSKDSFPHAGQAVLKGESHAA